MIRIVRNRAGHCDFCGDRVEVVSDVYCEAKGLKRLQGCSFCLKRLGDMAWRAHGQSLDVVEFP
jgi:hypothetical protein